MMRSLALVLLIAALATSGCKSNSTPTSPTPSAPFSATDLRVGTGAEAVAGRRVSVNFTGWLYDPAAAEGKGRRFDGGNYPFVLGTGAAIRGWDQGIPGMRVGGQRRLIIPPELAYGSQGAGNGTIPPNATLVFDVELVDVQ